MLQKNWPVLFKRSSSKTNKSLQGKYACTGNFVLYNYKIKQYYFLKNDTFYGDTMIKILMIGMGGFTGSVCRHLTYEFSNKVFNEPFLPYGTIIVNIAGCLFIGFLGGLFETRQLFTSEIRALILVGFLGGFTTFSTFGYEIFTIAKNGQYVAAITHLMIHLVLGFGAVWLGFSIYKYL